MSVRVGIDLVCTETVREAIRVHGDRYLNRVYTEQERRDCAGDADRLACAFAAKEAVMKALARRDEAVSWRSISVHRQSHGDPQLQLCGEAEALAHIRGLGDLHLSVTRSRRGAAAVVVAETAS